ncbi:Predicted protein [Lactobacillus helveticus CIRM-BIA 953]|uniref:Uncharacterized protein n=1 Tax=Lactobacillus helveticus CIRM-BIA 953 TaxID=1226335 RepID=U4QIU6_LACHE|nr:Predicted protein [Lactobacillus helveticus CIRM-BIA 953]CDI43361.1 Predicted protein [Lactobacillus helveticus CIRM-BIA 953]
MGQVRHPIAEENKRIGKISKHRRKRHRIVKNPLRGSLLERQIQRASYCIDHGCPNFTKWFIAETGMKPRDFIDKWERKRV